MRLFACPKTLLCVYAWKQSPWGEKEAEYLVDQDGRKHFTIYLKASVCACVCTWSYSCVHGGYMWGGICGCVYVCVWRLEINRGVFLSHFLKRDLSLTEPGAHRFHYASWWRSSSDPPISTVSKPGSRTGTTGPGFCRSQKNSGTHTCTADILKLSRLSGLLKCFLSIWQNCLFER